MLVFRIPLFRRLVLSVLSALLCAAVARAQSVSWENAEGGVGRLINLVFENCSSEGEPQLPPLSNGTLRLVGNSTKSTWENGRTTNLEVLTYLVQARGEVQIPSFSVKTNKGPLVVPAFNSAAPTAATDSLASSTLTPERNSVWAGEVFGMTYAIRWARRNNASINSGVDWNHAPLVVEEWSKPVINEQNPLEVSVTLRTRAIAKDPGSLKLQPVNVVLNVQTGSVTFGFFAQPRIEPLSVTSNQPAIEVRPLPTAPAGFTGAVGQFQIAGKVVPERAMVGEPITWTVELSGTGNWPDISGLPAREVSKDFQVIQPKAKRTPTEGKLFDATLVEDVVLMPTKAGTYTLPSLKFVYFDPQSGSYKTLRTDPVSVTIAPAPNANASTAASTAGPAEGSGTASAAAKPPQVPAFPSGIPNEALNGADEARRPMSGLALVTWLIAPLVGILALWFALAWRRAAQTDPLRRQREARARIATLLSEIRHTVSATQLAGSSSGSAELTERLLAWQHEAAVLWHLHHAAPSAYALEQIGGAANPGQRSGQPGYLPSEARAANAAEWAGLWREADRVLYGVKGTLPSDWVARAEAALAAKRVPNFQPAHLFLPRNLLPFAAAIAILATLTLPSLRAASDPGLAYRNGDFATAEKAWRERVRQHPTDWIARHNLALALAQQDRQGEALAHLAAAFVQQPGNASVRRHFALIVGKAGFVPGPLAAFVKDGPEASVAALTGPAGWQRVLILAAFLGAGAIGWVIWNAYGRRARLHYVLAAVVSLLAALLALTAVYGIKAYGDAAHPRAMVAWHPGVLRSIPTEADTTQKTTPLAVGTVGLAERDYLGWTLLTFGNGQTGWVRKDDIVPLW